MPTLDDLDKKYGAVAETSPGRGGISPVTSSFTAPPPGYGRAIRRGIAGGMAGIDQTAANILSLAGNFPNSASMAVQAEADRRRNEMSVIDAASETRPPTRGQRITATTGEALIGAAPYMVGGGRLTNALVGAVENADQGAGSALIGAGKALVGGEVAKVIGNRIVGPLMKAAPAIRSASDRVIRSAGSAATGAIMGAGMGLAGGRPIEEGVSQAIVGGVLGAAPRSMLKGQAPGSVAQTGNANTRRANKLQDALGPTPTANLHPAVESFEVVGDILDQTIKAKGMDPKNLTIKDMAKIIPEANRARQVEYESFLAPILQQVAPPNEVAAIKAALLAARTPTEIKAGTSTATARAHPEAAIRNAEITERVKRYDNPDEWTFEALEDRRKELFTKRDGKSKEQLAARTDTEKRLDTIEEALVKDLLYAKADTVAMTQGHQPGYVRDTIKNEQHHLIGLRDALQDRLHRLIENDAALKGRPLRHRLDVTMTGHPSGNITGNAHGLLKWIFGKPDTLESANKLVKSAFSPESRMAKIGGGLTPNQFIGPPTPASAVAASRNARRSDQPPVLDTQPPVAPVPTTLTPGARNPYGIVGSTAAPPVMNRYGVQP